MTRQGPLRQYLSCRASSINPCTCHSLSSLLELKTRPICESFNSTPGYAQRLTSSSGIAAGAVSTIRLMGGAIGVAVYSTILSDTQSSRLRENIAGVVKSANLPSSDLPKLIKAASLNTAAAYKAVPGITVNVVSLCRLAVKHAYTHAFSIVWYTALAFGALALVSAFFLKSIPPGLKTGERAVHLENERVLEDAAAEKAVDSV